MMKKIINITLILFVVLASMPYKVQAEAKTLGELRAAYNEVLKQKQENDNKTEAAKEEIRQKEAAIKQAEADIHKAEQEMEDAQKAIDESNKKIAELKEQMKGILLYYQQMQGGNAYVEYVSGATTMTDFITRVAAVEFVTASVEDSVDELKIEVEKNEQLKVELENKKKALEAQSEEYKKVIQARYSDISQYDKYALNIDEQLEVAKKNLDMNVKKCQETIGKTSDDVLLSECTKVPLNSGWLKPLTHGIITSQIGSRWGSYHNALDIGGNPEWTPVYAAAAGEVAARVERASCGGNMLFINVEVDGVKYLTYYYHLIQMNVNVGDVVTQDTVIGYVGGGTTASYDSCTFGAHLHFGVADGWYDIRYPFVNRSKVMTPPGFPNYEGWSFNSRTDMY